MTGRQPSQEELVGKARVFADCELRPVAGRVERRDALPRAVITKMGKRGYLAPTLPPERGGLGLDPLHYGLFTEAIGRACTATRALITVETSLVGETLLRYGSECQQERWLWPMAAGRCVGAFALSEPLVGSDARSVQTTYDECADGYVLNGRKRWVTFGGIADFFLVFAVQGECHAAFVVERPLPGVRVTAMGGLLAARGTYTAEMEMRDVRVPRENMVGAAGGGFLGVASTALDHGRYSIAWAGLAIAQEALDAMTSYARTRWQFGRPIGEHQLVQAMIADAVTDVHAARALCVQAGRMRTAHDRAAVTETSIAKYFTSKVAMRVASDCVQVHGGNGCSPDFVAERLFREAKLLEIIEGTSQIQQLVIADAGLRTHRVGCRT